MNPRRGSTKVKVTYTNNLRQPIPIHFSTQGLFAYWMTSNTFSLGQMLFLRIPAVRTFFGIPKMVDHSDMKTESGGFFENLKSGRHSSWMILNFWATRQTEQKLNFFVVGGFLSRKICTNLSESYCFPLGISNSSFQLFRIIYACIYTAKSAIALWLAL